MDRLLSNLVHSFIMSQAIHCKCQGQRSK